MGSKPSPVEQQQQGEGREVGGGDVGLLLEADEDQDDEGRRDDVVELGNTRGSRVC